MMNVAFECQVAIEKAVTGYIDNLILAGQGLTPATVWLRHLWWYEVLVSRGHIVSNEIEDDIKRGYNALFGENDIGWRD